MARINITARTLSSLKPQTSRLDYFDANLPAFCVRVTPSGNKSFSVFYRHAGRLRRFTLGTYPRLSLAVARKMAREALRDAEMGIDPAARKKSDRLDGTFADLADSYIERYAKKKKRSWKEDERQLKIYILPRFRNVTPDGITRADIRSLLEKIADMAPIQANRVLALIRRIYSWSLEQNLVEVNPCIGIKGPGTEKPRDRVLSHDEVRKVWRAAETQDPETEAMFKLRILTAQRSGEIASVRWKDLDLESGWWTIPGSVAKNGLAHRVPLSPQALRLLEKLRKHRAVSESIERRASEWVFPHRSRPEGHITELQKAVQRVRREAGVDFRAHDLRRTAASLMTGMEIPRLIVGRILNHAEVGATKVYDRHSCDKEKRDALDLWASRLILIVADLQEVEKSDRK